MATVNLSVEVPNDEVEEFRRALVQLCFDHGLPVDDEDEFEEDTMPGVVDLPPDEDSVKATEELKKFLDNLQVIVIL